MRCSADAAADDEKEEEADVAAAAANNDDDGGGVDDALPPAVAALSLGRRPGKRETTSGDGAGLLYGSVARTPRLLLLLCEADKKAEEEDE